jgi:4a-hydroxytetrahydrobiopterin dehydratase
MARPPVLDEADVRAALAGPDGPRWELVDGRLVTEVECASFTAALDFVLAVGRLAEEADHHPDIDIRWRTVRLALVTHDAGGITDLDLDLARAVDALGGGAP